MAVAAEWGADTGRAYQPSRSSGYFIDEAGPSIVLPHGPAADPDAYRQVPARDAHRGVRGYAVRRCEACHAEQVANLHTQRGNNTCRQCHGPDPIASIGHYFSSMNPIRRHAYVCAKCHEGAGASFATYVVHQPSAGEAGTRETFPFLYYAYWFMFWLLIGVFAVFIPHSLGWWLREWFTRRRAAGEEG